MKLSNYKTFEEAEYALMLKLEAGYQPETPSIMAAMAPPHRLNSTSLTKRNIELIEGGSTTTVAVALVGEGSISRYGGTHKIMHMDRAYIIEQLAKYDLEQEKEFENNIKKEYLKLLDIRDRLNCMKANDSIKYLP